MNKLSYDDVKSNLYKRGYILLEENYKNTRNKILVEDFNGYKYFVSYTNIIKTESYSLNNNKIINTNNYILSFITRYKSLDEIHKLVDDKNNILITEDITINKNSKDKFEDSTNTPVFL